MGGLHSLFRSMWSSPPRPPYPDSVIEYCSKSPFVSDEDLRIKFSQYTLPDSKWYFAFGSNLSALSFRKRRGIQPLEWTPVILKGWELTFDLPGFPYIEPAFANLKINPESEVHGIAYRISDAQLAHLHRTEASYDLAQVKVKPYAPSDAKELTAYVCVTSPRIRRFTPLQEKQNYPSIRYLKLLQVGAREANLHPDWINKLDQLPASPKPNKLVIFTIVVVLSPIIVIYFLVNQVGRLCIKKETWHPIQLKMLMTLKECLWSMYTLCGIKSG
jgi:hypothetical protein